jgi:hypothetical protein
MPVFGARGLSQVLIHRIISKVKYQPVCGRAQTSESLSGASDRSRPLAQSDSQTAPPFIARPEGAPIYRGFQILSDVVVDGFTFGKISDLEAHRAQREMSLSSRPATAGQD